MISGPFENEAVLNRFKDEDVIDETGKVIYHGSKIIEATPEKVVYSDGLVLKNPLKPTPLDSTSYTRLMAYMDSATQVEGTSIRESSDPLSTAIGEALIIWDNDLNHIFGEWERPRKLGKPNPKFNSAAEYAYLHLHEPILRVAEKFKVNYHKFVNDLRNRAFSLAGQSSGCYNKSSEV